ncbi:hypothetical protein [Vibrio cholerae]|uniref:hypothetical protein n=1 Tax=Vibrio cholerae TaxID=666 RepID=UPI0030FEE3AD
MPIVICLDAGFTHQPVFVFCQDDVFLVNIAFVYRSERMDTTIPASLDPKMLNPQDRTTHTMNRFICFRGVSPFNRATFHILTPLKP